MTRELDTKTLDLWAADNAKLFTRNQGRYDRNWIMKQFYNMTFKDEFDYIVKKFGENLKDEAAADFDERINVLLAEHPRSEEVFAQLLEEKKPVNTSNA